MLNTKGLKVGIFPSQTLRFILYTVICGLPLMLVAKVLCGDSVYLPLLMLNTKGLEVRIFPSRTLRFILYTVICGLLYFPNYFNFQL
jgi:hypothetical protein